MPGRILVAPPGRHTLITPRGQVALILSGDRPPYRPSADLLLTSLALSAGPYAIAVVLSGYGNDGATGATAVHHFGGSVIASDRATSTVFTMPSATITRDQIVDHVAPVDAIVDLLITTIGAMAARIEAAGASTAEMSDRVPGPHCWCTSSCAPSLAEGDHTRHPNRLCRELRLVPTAGTRADSADSPMEWP